MAENSSDRLNKAVTNVRMLKSAGIYVTGDVAGFPSDVARRMISSGVAEAYQEQPHPAFAPPPEGRRPAQQASAV